MPCDEGIRSEQGGCLVSDDGDNHGGGLGVSGRGRPHQVVGTCRVDGRWRQSRSAKEKPGMWGAASRPGQEGRACGVRGEGPTHGVEGARRRAGADSCVLGKPGGLSLPGCVCRRE